MGLVVLRAGVDTIEASFTGVLGVGLADPSMSTAALVEARARTASRARVAFATGDETARKKVVTALPCSPKVQDGRIASYQYKDPFGVLEMDSSGAFCHSWWALEDLNL